MVCSISGSQIHDDELASHGIRVLIIQTSDAPGYLAGETIGVNGGSLMP